MRLLTPDLQRWIFEDALVGFIFCGRCRLEQGVLMCGDRELPASIVVENMLEPRKGKGL